ncbi:MAG TPA: pyridoxine 5'-phosphate synthase [Pseudomonadales bacterium]|nr:pyridoxine 5'-phosphate synthase [Pseudomonadales bacterium]
MTTLHPRTALSVNLNKIALIRNSRVTTIPNVVDFAHTCINAGADGITVHPRPDQRHIRASDCVALAEAISVEFNIEGNPFAPPQKSKYTHVGDYPGFMALVAMCRPAQCTLVPDGDGQLTSDHGFDLYRDADKLAPIIAQLHALGCRVSLFMDPIPEQMPLAKAIGADRIEWYTGPYAEAHAEGHWRDSWQAYQQATEAALTAGLGVNAGHDLNLDNLADFLKIPGILEVSIGHALTVDALVMGMGPAVKAYRNCIDEVFQQA